MSSLPAVALTRLEAPRQSRSLLLDDVRTGLFGTPKSLPSRWFYDARGDDLFEQITRLPEYDLTRTESAILERCAADVMASVAPVELLELGSGSSRKTRVLLEAMHARGGDALYLPLDVSESAIVDAGTRLLARYRWLSVHGIVGDFSRHLQQVPRRGRRLIAFLGSTLGNLDEPERASFFRAVRAALLPGDGLLLGADLVKSAEEHERAYDDAAGVTAAFNLNVLSRINRELGAQFPLGAFRHVARFDVALSRVEMRLRAQRALSVKVPGLLRPVVFEAGEDILTEISCKFTRAALERELAACGLKIEQWATDERSRFALALVTGSTDARERSRRA